MMVSSSIQVLLFCDYNNNIHLECCNWLFHKIRHKLNIYLKDNF